MSLITLMINVTDSDKLNQILSLTKTIGASMATQADIDNLTAQVTKVMSEVTAATNVLVAAVAALQAQIDAGQPVLDLSALNAAVQALDDINPDQTPV